MSVEPNNDITPRSPIDNVTEIANDVAIELLIMGISYFNILDNPLMLYASKSRE